MIKKIIQATIILLQFVIQNHVVANDVQKSENTQPIAVIINSELYPQVKESIDRYLDDLEKEGYNVIFSTWDYNAHPNVEELKTLLKEYHQNLNLKGAVLIGKLPYANGKVDNNEGPIETYLMDLYSTNFIKNRNGKITEHQCFINLDIWVSRIWAPQEEPRLLLSGISEANLIKNYFEKNHLYRTCQSPVPDLKIEFYADDEYRILSRRAVAYLISWINFYQYLEESGYPQKYLDFVKNNPAQYLYLKSHSEPEFHQFMFSGRSEFYDSSSISNNAHIKQPFILLDDCSACRFSDSESLGNAYLFGPHSSALVIAGLTIPGNLIDIPFLHSNGKSFGDNALIHFNFHGEIIFSTTYSTLPYFSATAINALWYAISQPTFSSLARDILASIGCIEFIKYKYKEEAINDKCPLSLGFTLLGDPTLKPHINMDWCPEYDAKKDL